MARLCIEKTTIVMDSGSTHEKVRGLPVRVSVLLLVLFVAVLWVALSPNPSPLAIIDSIIRVWGFFQHQ